MTSPITATHVADLPPSDNAPPGRRRRVSSAATAAPSRVVLQSSTASAALGTSARLLPPELQLAIEQVPVGRVRGYKRHARKHSERQITQLAANIATFGFVVPIMLDANDEIIAGHARLAAAKELGLATVPAIRLHHLDEAAVRALRIADNRLAELASWDEEVLAIELRDLVSLDLDFSIELTGFSTGEIDLMLDGAPGDVADDPADAVPDAAACAVTRPGDLWLLGSHRLICGSALEASVYERLMAGEKARTVFTDPPYNVPVGGHVCGLGRIQHREFPMASGEMSETEFTTFLQAALANMTAHTIDGGLVYVCMDWRHLYELQAAARAAELSTVNLCVWAKDNGGMGSFYRSQHELVLVMKHGQASHQNLVELGRHGRYRTNVWNYAGINTMRKGRLDELAMHPTVKPTSLVADAIRDSAKRGEWVLDAFSGSGTTIVAAERSGRRAAAIELDPLYVDVAVQRWQALTGEAVILAETGQTFAEVAAEREADANREAEEGTAVVEPEDVRASAPVSPAMVGENAHA